MYDRKDIILAVDYHAENTEVRWLNWPRGEERCLNIPTTRGGILRLVEKAMAEAAPVGGKVVWIMESTTGWARVKELIGSRVQFVLANVLQMPLPPKAYRRKSDKIDTGQDAAGVPQRFAAAVVSADGWWREVRRLVDSRQDLVERQTAVKNWITHFLHHETWADREGLWTQKGLKRLRALEAVGQRSDGPGPEAARSWSSWRSGVERWKRRCRRSTTSGRRRSGWTRCGGSGW